LVMTLAPFLVQLRRGKLRRILARIRPQHRPRAVVALDIPADAVSILVHGPETLICQRDSVIHDYCPNAVIRHA